MFKAKLLCELLEEAAIPIASEPILSVWEYKEVRLWCNATGVPEPKVTWYVLETTSQQTAVLRGTCRIIYTHTSFFDYTIKPK